MVVVFVLIIALRPEGTIKLGPDHSKPQFNLFTWTAMLFAAGIGIDLMFFSVSEPVTQYYQPPAGPGENVHAAREAVVWALFHYGPVGWAPYALFGGAFAYFAYRRNLPLSIRSLLAPLLGNRVHGWLGHSVDIAAVLGTVFGIATSLGIGVVQLNYGLKLMFGIPEGTAAQIGLIVVSVAMATASTLSGGGKGHPTALGTQRGPRDRAAHLGGRHRQYAPAARWSGDERRRLLRHLPRSAAQHLCLGAAR